LEYLEDFLKFKKTQVIKIRNAFPWRIKCQTFIHNCVGERDVSHDYSNECMQGFSVLLVWKSHNRSSA